MVIAPRKETGQKSKRPDARLIVPERLSSIAMKSVLCIFPKFPIDGPFSKALWLLAWFNVRYIKCKSWEQGPRNASLFFFFLFPFYRRASPRFARSQDPSGIGRNYLLTRRPKEPRRPEHMWENSVKWTQMWALYVPNRWSIVRKISLVVSIKTRRSTRLPVELRNYFQPQFFTLQVPSCTFFHTLLRKESRFFGTFPWDWRP